jgi:hypothetical protein
MLNYVALIKYQLPTKQEKSFRGSRKFSKVVGDPSMLE